MSEMSPAEEIFFAALEQPSPTERAAYLDAACAGQPELRARVEKLLAAHPKVGGFLEPGPAGEATATFGAVANSLTAAHPSNGEHAGAVIACKYTLVEPIGEGGMGSVWRARQTEPVKRYVAVKLIKPGMDSKQVLARFEAERQALALMDHPNIATVLDGGIHEGRPYFVMELVKGVPITEYCDKCKLTPKERLELFVPVCQAIQHAHQKGVIHRDIKPSNVLVALYDDRPVVKVIDFGVAKATGAALTEKTIDTGFGGVVGTPQYMSPEQATFNNLDVDTRSDVYALGVLLYELLTGTTPFSKKELEKRGLLEMLRVVREDEPPRPSTKLSTADALPTLSANRGTEPKKLTGLLRNELDWIVMKALEKDRVRRYETANGFAGDVLRYLAGEVVQAHPPSRGYRLRKFVRRNRGQVVAAGLVLAALLAGVAGTTWGLIQARRQEGIARAEAAEKEQARAAEAERAEGERLARLDAQEKERLAAAAADKERAARLEEERQRKFAEAIAGFVQKDFLALTSVEGQFRFGGAGKEVLSKDTTLRELLDRAAAKLRARKDLEPRTEAELCWIVGVNYRGAGDARKGIEFLERAVRLRSDLLGRDHADTLRAMDSLAVAYSAAGQPERELPLLEEAFELSKARLGPEHPDTLYTMGNLASAYLDGGKRDRAVPLFEECLKLCKATLGPVHPQTLNTMNNLAEAYREAGKVDKALRLHAETFELTKVALGPDHPSTLMSMGNLALAYHDAGKDAQSLPLLKEAFTLNKAKLGPEHPQTLTSQDSLAGAYEVIGRLDLAVPLLQEAVEFRKAKLGPAHPDTLRSMDNLAMAHGAAGKVDRALPLLEEALALRKAKLGPAHPDTLRSMGDLAGAYQAAGKLDLCPPLFEEMLKHQKARFGPDHPGPLSTRIKLASAYYDTGKFDLAVSHFNEVLIRSRKTLAKDSPQLSQQLSWLGMSLLQTKAFAEAEQPLRECLAIREKAEPDAWTTFNTQSMLGGALLGQKKYADAERLLLAGYEGMKARADEIPKVPQTATRIPEALDRLVELYAATNKPDEVKKWQAERMKYPFPAQKGPMPREVK